MVARLVSLTRNLNSKIGYLRPLQCRHFSIVESEVAHHEYLHHMPVTTFSEDEELIRQAVRQWAREILLPVVRDMDDQGKLRAEIIASLFQNGFMGMVSVKRTNKKEFFQLCHSYLILLAS
jgi:Acyl-CoA dehydrogenase, N-terminal domain